MNECVEGGSEGRVSEREGSEAFIEGGKWTCHSLRKEEGRESSDVTAKEGLFMDPFLESVSELGRPPARWAAHSLTDVSTSEEGLVSHSAPGSEKTEKE